MSHGTENESVPPFFEETTHPPANKTTQTMRMVMMLIGLGALGVSMLGGARLLWEILAEGLANNQDTIGAKLLWVAIPYVFGWIVSLISIRAMNNLVLPLIIQFFIAATITGITLLYGRVIQMLYMEAFSASHYLRYSLVFAAGFAALVGLHLLIEDHDLRPFCIPILVATLIHLFVAVLHYVFQEGKSTFAMGDLMYFVGMLVIVILMALHLGVLNPFRHTIDRVFLDTEETVQP
jgi:hypothetical protein